MLPGPHNRRDRYKKMERKSAERKVRKQGLQNWLNKEIIMCTISVVYKIKQQLAWGAQERYLKFLSICSLILMCMIFHHHSHSHTRKQVLRYQINTLNWKQSIYIRNN